MSMPTAMLRVACLVLASGLAASGPQTPSPAASTAGSTKEGLDLLHTMQDGLGGAKNIAAIRDLDETIKAEAWDSAGTALGAVRKRTRWIRNPNTLRLDQIGPRGTYVLYFEGGS